MIAKATRVDGVYDKDPLKFPDAVNVHARSPTRKCLSQALGVMDATSIAMCRDNKLPILVFNLNTDGQYNANVDGRDGRHDHPLTDRIEEGMGAGS